MGSASSHLRLVQAIVRPIVRFLVRRGVVFQEFDAIARRCFVEAGVEELSQSTKKINLSRLSILTGLQRPEVARHLQAQELESSDSALSLSARVLARWEQDPEFLTKDRSPRILKHQGEESDFARLCAGVSTAINAGTMLFELQRLGSVKTTPFGVKFIRAEQGTLHDISKAHALLEEELTLALTSIDQNIRRENEVPNHHNRTSFDNIYVHRIDEVRRWLMEEGRAFHRRVREYLSQHDKDVAPHGDEAAPAGAKVVLSSMSMTVLPQEDEEGAVVPARIVQKQIKGSRRRGK